MFPISAPADIAESNLAMKRVLTGGERTWLAGMVILRIAASVYLCAAVAEAVQTGIPAALSVLFVAALAVLCCGCVLRCSMIGLMAEPLPAIPEEGLRVAAVTTFVSGGEPVAMLENTLRAMLRMDYPHETWVLDESDDPEARRLCASLGVQHFSRKNRPEYRQPGGIFEGGSKHGNYNAWLYSTGYGRYDIISAFDPDHVPEPGFLAAVLGHFRDPQVGYVQLPQAYYNQKASFVARGASEETRAFYSIVQRSYQYVRSPAIIGCHNTHRVAALRQAGGFAAHAADDLLLSLIYRSLGWKGVYVPRIIARGLTPVDWRGYLSQQRRWSRSLLDVKFRILPGLASRWPARERLMSFLQGCTYLQDAAVGLSVLVGLMVILATGFGAGAFSTLHRVDVGLVFAALILTDLYVHRYFIDRAEGAGLHWRAAVLRFSKWPYTLISLYEVLRNRRVPYTLTQKRKAESRRVMFWPHLIMAGGIAAAWVAGTLAGFPRDHIINVWALAAVLGCLAMVVSGFQCFPAPYDPELHRPVTAGARPSRFENPG